MLCQVFVRACHFNIDLPRELRGKEGRKEGGRGGNKTVPWFFRNEKVIPEGSNALQGRESQGQKIIIIGRCHVSFLIYIVDFMQV